MMNPNLVPRRFLPSKKKYPKGKKLITLTKLLKQKIIGHFKDSLVTGISVDNDNVKSLN